MSKITKRSPQPLRAFTQDPHALEALYEYTRNAFQGNSSPQFHTFPLPDEPQVQTWLRYSQTAREIGVFETLKQYLVQFQFPVKAGMSQESGYRDATLKGRETASIPIATGLSLCNPGSIELLIYQSPAGKIPVLIVPDRADFHTIIQALTARNEPRSIPDSMGAAMINGLNNWDRIRRLKSAWLAEHPYGNWNSHFRTFILPNKDLYRDRIIVLSKNGYSGVSAKSLGLKEDEWMMHSLAIRLEHECAHFFTLRYFGYMANHMHDELIADYMGITKAVGKFKADWFLRFLGLESYPTYREGGRIQSYLGTPPLSPQAFKGLQHLMKSAAEQVELFDHSLPFAESDLERTYRLLALCRSGLDQIAKPEGAKHLSREYHQIRNRDSLRGQEFG